MSSFKVIDISEGRVSASSEQSKGGHRSASSGGYLVGGVMYDYAPSETKVVRPKRILISSWNNRFGPDVSDWDGLYSDVNLSDRYLYPYTSLLKYTRDDIKRAIPGTWTELELRMRVVIGTLITVEERVITKLDAAMMMFPCVASDDEDFFSKSRVSVRAAAKELYLATVKRRYELVSLEVDARRMLFPGVTLFESDEGYSPISQSIAVINSYGFESRDCGDFGRSLSVCATLSSPCVEKFEQLAIVSSVGKASRVRKGIITLAALVLASQVSIVSARGGWHDMGRLTVVRPFGLEHTNINYFCGNFSTDIEFALSREYQFDAGRYDYWNVHAVDGWLDNGQFVSSQLLVDNSEIVDYEGFRCFRSFFGKFHSDEPGGLTFLEDITWSVIILGMFLVFLLYIVIMSWIRILIWRWLCWCFMCLRGSSRGYSSF